LLLAGDHSSSEEIDEALPVQSADPDHDEQDADPAPEPEPDPEPEPEPDEPEEPAEPTPLPTPQRRDRLDYRDAEFEELEAPENEPWTVGRVFRLAVRVTAYAIIGSIVWVLAYRILPAPFTLLMVSETLFEGRDITHEWVPLERISPNLIRAVIASEDNEFCHHWGFDFKELQDAWQEGQRGGRLRGASTISQQTAKNAFLWPGRSYVRKGVEAYFTVLMETFWPKRRIMEVYLNVIEWGPGTFGAEAAARRWFGKSAARLSPLEAARLAAILPNPNRYRANPPGPYVNGRGYTIQARANNVDLNGDDRCAKP
jgi:monofunctional biosynthetic peptidoglycan transglycosylase